MPPPMCIRGPRERTWGTVLTSGEFPGDSRVLYCGYVSSEFRGAHGVTDVLPQSEKAQSIHNREDSASSPLCPPTCGAPGRAHLPRPRAPQLTLARVSPQSAARLGRFTATSDADALCAPTSGAAHLVSLLARATAHLDPCPCRGAAFRSALRRHRNLPVQPHPRSQHARSASPRAMHLPERSGGRPRASPSTVRSSVRPSSGGQV